MIKLLLSFVSHYFGELNIICALTITKSSAKNGHPLDVAAVRYTYTVLVFSEGSGESVFMHRLE